MVGGVAANRNRFSRSFWKGAGHNDCSVTRRCAPGCTGVYESSRHSKNQRLTTGLSKGHELRVVIEWRSKSAWIRDWYQRKLAAGKQVVAHGANYQQEPNEHRSTLMLEGISPIENVVSVEPLLAWWVCPEVCNRGHSVRALRQDGKGSREFVPLHPVLDVGIP
jgi:hypothetical protein